MISQQLIRGTPHKVPELPEMPAEVLALGAKMLKVAVAFDNLRMKSATNDEAVLRLRYRSEFDRELVDALVDMKYEESKMELRKVPISTLTVGMILQQDVRNHNGVLVVAKGRKSRALCSSGSGISPWRG